MRSSGPPDCSNPHDTFGQGSGITGVIRDKKSCPGNLRTRHDIHVVPAQPAEPCCAQGGCPRAGSIPWDGMCPRHHCGTLHPTCRAQGQLILSHRGDGQLRAKLLCGYRELGAVRFCSECHPDSGGESLLLPAWLGCRGWRQSPAALGFTASGVSAPVLGHKQLLLIIYITNAQL